MGLIEDINRPEETPLHTSGYAEVANSGGLGAASAETFSQRQSLDGNRKVVGAYNKSFLGSGYIPYEQGQGRIKSRGRLQKAPARKEDSLGYQDQQRQAMNSGLNVPARPAPGFREPPARGYNPYA